MIASRLVASFLLGAASLATALPSLAYTVAIDEFSVSKNGTTIFSDSFNDGLAPPNNPLSPLTYTVNGTVGPENSGGNGRLVMDQSGAAFATNAYGNYRAYQRVQLNTNASNTTNASDPNYAFGLKSWHDFSVSGIFDYSTPSPDLVYGIQLVDFSSTSPTSGNDTLFLTVYGGGIGPQIAFYQQNYTGGTVTLIDGTPIPVSTLAFDQVHLMLDHAGGTNNISASWEYLLGGSVVGNGSFSAMGTLFSDEPFTRASFIVSAPIPEPSTYTMMLAGLGLFTLMVRRRRSL